MKNGIKMMSAALLAGAMAVTATPAEAGRNSTGSVNGAASGKASPSKAKGKTKVKAGTSRAASPSKRAKSPSKAPKVSGKQQNDFTANYKGKRAAGNTVFQGEGRQREATASQTMPSGGNPFASTSGSSGPAQAGQSRREATASGAMAGSSAAPARGNRKAKASDVIGRSNPFASGSRNSQPKTGVVNQLVGFFNSQNAGAASVSKGVIKSGDVAKAKRRGNGNS